MGIHSVQQGAQSAYLSKEVAAKAQAASGTKGSETAKSSEDAIVDLNSGRTSDVGYSRPKSSKGLGADEIKALKQAQETNQANFIRSMMQSNTIKQADQAKGITKFNFGGLLMDASAFELPAGGSTPEEARKAIAEGGAYSVGAVSDRIFSMAEKLANGDSAKLEKLRDAVQKGFKQAGVDFNSMSKSKLPQICNDTYDEIMSRFDKLAEQLKQPEQPPTNPADQANKILQ